MLLKYIVSNYKSIGHDVEFSMLPTSGNTDDRFTSTIHTKAGEWKVLHRGVLFGANASGKSAFIESIRFAKRFITQGQRSGRRIPVNQFKKPIADLDGLTTFQFLLYIEGEVYDYGFSLDNERVHEEWLERLEQDGKFQNIFERKTFYESHMELIVNGGELGIDSKFASMLASTLQEKQKNQLFLYKLYDNGVSGVEDLFEWFDGIEFVFPDSQVKGLDRRVAKDKDFAIELSHFLQRADTGVENVTTKDLPIDAESFFKQINLPDEILQELYDAQQGTFQINNRYYIFETENGQIKLMETKFQHQLHGEGYFFNRGEESDGTQRLLDLFPILYNNQRKGRKIYFIDELDRSLHTALTTEFLNQFIKLAKECQSQLVITAHDVNIMNLKKLSPDEIWFLEKNRDGETQIRPFSDFDVDHNGYDVMRSYLEGRFGAVPYIKEEN